MRRKQKISDTHPSLTVTIFNDDYLVSGHGLQVLHAVVCV